MSADDHIRAPALGSLGSFLARQSLRAIVVVEAEALADDDDDASVWVSVGNRSVSVRRWMYCPI